MMKKIKEELLKRATKSIEENESKSRTPLSKEQLARHKAFIDDYKSLPPLPDVAEKIYEHGIKEKMLQHYLDTIMEKDNKLKKGKSEGGTEGAKTKRKDADVRRQIFKNLITEDLINEWRRSEEPFPKWFHDGLHGNLQPPPILLTDYVNNPILTVSLDTLRKDLKLKGIKPKRKP